MQKYIVHKSDLANGQLVNSKFHLVPTNDSLAKYNYLNFGQWIIG